jgi:archaellum biogenesis ATPase FlaH
MSSKINNIADAKKLVKDKKSAAKNFDWLSTKVFDQSKKIDYPDPIINIQGKTILTAGNYITISGKPKAGKSAFISGIIAAAVTKDNKLGINVTMPATAPNIVHLDTEQGEYEYYQSMAMVKKIAGIDQMPANFISYRLRGCKAEQIREALAHVCTIAANGLIIIDGLLDTIIDFNDIKECRMITDLLRDITERTKIGIVCIIHQSKGNGYTIGHLGSFSDRYSQSVLEVVRDTDKQISTLKPVYLRSAGNFESINIDYDLNNHVWKSHHLTPEEQKSKGNEPSQQDIEDFFSYLFVNRSYVTYKMIEDDARSKLKIPKNKVSDLVKRLFDLNLIVKDGEVYKIASTPF